jgi:hypothetical protein
METLEAGKSKVENHIMELSRGMKLEDSVYSILWWPGAEAGAPFVGTQPETAMALRIYCKGTGWRSMELASSDVDGCAEAPGVLEKYDWEICRMLAEM